jgi:hypothetical protein
MKDKVIVSTLIATITASISFVLANYIMGSHIDWKSAIGFIIVFAVVFDITWRLRHRKNK